MADMFLSGQRGTTFSFTAPAGADITAAGTIVTFTAKTRRSDTATQIKKTYRQAGGSDVGIGPNGADHQTVLVVIEPADTAAFADTEFLVFDLVMTQGAVETVLAKGSLTVRAGVGT